MRHVVFVEPGVLRFEEAPAPQLQGPGEALVRPLAVSRCDLDVAIVRGRAPAAGPFALGHECVAEVVEVGPDVRDVAVGQRVVVPFAINCGACARCRAGQTGRCLAVPPNSWYGLGAMGGAWGGFLADRVRVPYADAMLVGVPAGVDPVAVAAAGDNISDAYRTVAPGLARFPGGTVLVLAGAAPSVGLYAAAIAVALGAGRVDYADRSADRLRLAASLGATPVELSGKTVPERLGAYDVTVDAHATEEGLACALRSTSPGGVCTSAGIYFGEARVPMFDMVLSGVTLTVGLPNTRALLPEVLALVARGAFRPERITTRVAAWDDAPEALLAATTKLVVAR